MDPERLRRLAELGIEPLSLDSRSRHIYLVRAPYAAMAERHESGWRTGSAGRITDRGLAVIVWREQTAWFTARGFEEQATPAEIAGLRQFQADLAAALHDASAPLP
ncbi:MAG: hypothetical protein R2729_06480 [Bryobacteraceae bacterium]